MLLLMCNFEVIICYDKSKKVVVVMPAYNAFNTLKKLIVKFHFLLLMM